MFIVLTIIYFVCFGMENEDEDETIHWSQYWPEDEEEEEEEKRTLIKKENNPKKKNKIHPVIPKKFVEERVRKR